MATVDASRANMLQSAIFSKDKHRASLPWILHHILDCGGPPELPLRVMFSFNSEQNLPSLKQARQWWRNDRQGKLVSEFLSSIDKTSSEDASLNQPSVLQEANDQDDYRAAGDRFMDPGNDTLLDITKFLPPAPEQIQGLPTTFVHSFCLRIFAKQLADIDWGLALAGMDYLRDFERTRRAALRDAAKRLGITRDDWRDALRRDPDARTWVEQVQTQELRIEGFYAKLFVELRIWIMVHQLQSIPFVKTETLAMLNTLFPPSIQELPNDRISHKVLYRYRATFYQYTMAVETSGPRVIDAFIDKLLRPGSRHSWREARENLEVYLDLADCIIQQARAVHSISFFRDNRSDHSRTLSEARSSFSDRPATASSKHTSFDEHSVTCNPQTMTQSTSQSSRTPGHSEQPSLWRRRKFSAASVASDATCHGEQGSSRKPLLASRDGAGSISTIRQPLKVQIPPVDHPVNMGRPRKKSASITPFVEKRSEAARHGSFSRPVTPLADPRVVLHRHRRTLSSPQKPPIVDTQIKPATKVAGEFASPIPPLTSSSISLPSDSFAFLQKPYEPPPVPPLPQDLGFCKRFPLKTKASSGAATLREAFKADGLGIRLKTAKSMENVPSSFDHTDHVEPKPRRTLRHAISQTFVRTPEALRPKPSGGVPAHDSQPPRPLLRSKMSLPSLRKKKSFASQDPSPTSVQSPKLPAPILKKKMSFADIIQSPLMAQSPSMQVPTLKKKKSFASIIQSPLMTQSPSMSIPMLKKTKSFASIVQSPIAQSPSMQFPTLKKKKSLVSLIKSPAPPPAPAPTPSPVIVQSPTIAAIEEPWVYFKETDDEYERYTLLDPPPSILKAPSLYSYRSATESDKTITPTSLQNRPICPPQSFSRRLFSRDVTDITAMTRKLEHPPPRKLRSPSRVTFEDTPERAWGLEYARAWFLREARMKRFGIIAGADKLLEGTDGEKKSPPRPPRLQER